MVNGNFWNARLALVEFCGRASTWQHSVMVYQLRRPVYARWLYAAVLSGALDLPSFEAEATLCDRQHSPDHADEIEGHHQPVTLIEAGKPCLRAVQRWGSDPYLMGAPVLNDRTQRPILE